MVATVQFAQIVVDCADAASLARFYAALLERQVSDGANAFFAFIPGTADPPFPGLMFLQVPEPPRGKNRVHMDLASDDREAAVARAVELGAVRRGDFDEYDTVWTTLADPEGNLFDVASRR
jgi:predicted enzyme related to lactoylglutathione lyase